MRRVKSIFKSKTFWFNTLAGLGAILVEVSNILPDVGLDPKWVLFSVAIINIILRYVTTQPVALSAPEDPEVGRRL